MTTSDVKEARLANSIDALLPQTQCTRCGYPGCRPYAEAVAAGKSDFNRCHPGGEATLLKLAALLERNPVPLAFPSPLPSAVALVDEPRCIGCTLCYQACPVDAVLGAAKQLHTVITSECTGCELCLPPCPVDCIAMVPMEHPGWTPQQARRRYQAKLARLKRREEERKRRMAKKRAALEKSEAAAADPKRAAIEAAIKRVAAKKAAQQKATGADIKATEGVSKPRR